MPWMSVRGDPWTFNSLMSAEIDISTAKFSLEVVGSQITQLGLLTTAVSWVQQHRLHNSSKKLTWEPLDWTQGNSPSPVMGCLQSKPNTSGVEAATAFDSISGQDKTENNSTSSQNRERRKNDYQKDPTNLGATLPTPTSEWNLSIVLSACSEWLITFMWCWSVLMLLSRLVALLSCVTQNESLHLLHSVFDFPWENLKRLRELI